MTTNDAATEPTPAMPAPAAISPSIAAAVRDYTPRFDQRGLSQAVWATWAPLLRERCLAAAQSRAHVSAMLGISLDLLAWALTNGLPISSNPERLWTEGTRGRFLHSLSVQGRTEASVATAKSNLARMAEAVVPDPTLPAATPTAAATTVIPPEVGWALADDREPVPVTDLGLADAPVYWALLRAIGTRVRTTHPDAVKSVTVQPGREKALPYGLVEVSRLFRAAPTLPVASTRDAARAYLALGLGAGIAGKHLAFVMPGDIREDDETGTLTVGVRGDRDVVVRRVPVLAPFAPLLLHLRTASGDRPLLRGRNGSSNAANRPFHLASSLAARDPHAVRLDSTRLRATWLAVHLACGTPLPQLLKYAGLTRLSSIESLLAFVPPVERGPAEPWAGVTFGPDVVV